MNNESYDLDKEFEEVCLIGMTRAQVDCADPDEERVNFDKALAAEDRLLKAKEEQHNYELKMKELEIKLEEIKAKSEDSKRSLKWQLGTGLAVAGVTAATAFIRDALDFRRKVALTKGLCEFERTGFFTTIAGKEISKKLFKDLGDIKF